VEGDKAGVSQHDEAGDFSARMSVLLFETPTNSYSIPISQTNGFRKYHERCKNKTPKQSSRARQEVVLDSV